jgi:hypothetical protein
MISPVLFHHVISGGWLVWQCQRDFICFDDNDIHAHNPASRKSWEKSFAVCLLHCHNAELVCT